MANREYVASGPFQLEWPIDVEWPIDLESASGAPPRVRPRTLRLTTGPASPRSNVRSGTGLGKVSSPARA